MRCPWHGHEIEVLDWECIGVCGGPPSYMVFSRLRLVRNKGTGPERKLSPTSLVRAVIHATTSTHIQTESCSNYTRACARTHACTHAHTG